MSLYWLEVAKKIQSLAQDGLAYTKGKYDVERYEMLRDISIDIIQKHTDLETKKIREIFANETGYQTPKVDIRGVVFKDDKILMVREESDGCWSIPGGWADVGYTPGEIAAKEVLEESGLIVKPVKLFGVLDSKCYLHPPSLYHIYKIFILCEIIGGEFKTSIETTEVNFFDRNNLPKLSTERNTQEQIGEMFEFLDNPNKAILFD